MNPLPRERDISFLEIYDLDTGTSTLVRRFDYLIEAPNWSADGRALFFNSGGLIHRLDLTDGHIDTLASGPASDCNNDHVLAPDGQAIAVSSGTDRDPASHIFIVPFDGRPVTRVTEHSPSYLHGWSPDGTTLAYCGARDGQFDIYTVPVTGGDETRLTDTPGLDDGPEYSPCGRYIWFNSDRSGTMQLYRMRADGSDPVRMTHDTDRHHWFPHISPDGTHVVSIAYDAAEVAANDHPPHRHCALRLMRADGSDLRTLCTLFGGQGTLNVNSWAPGSRAFAYVRYRRPHEGGTL